MVEDGFGGGAALRVGLAYTQILAAAATIASPHAHTDEVTLAYEDLELALRTLFTVWQAITPR